MNRIDAHQHYWTLGLGHNDWPTPELTAIYRDFEPADLKPYLKIAGVTKTVLVQAAPNIAETEFLLALSEREDSVGAVVGWVDILAQDARETLLRLKRHPKFKGIRPMLQAIEDTTWILQPAAFETLSVLPDLDLRFDALIQPRHLPVVTALADRLPGLSIVVDHAAKPFIARRSLEPWASDMAALARRPNVCAKLSGLVTEAGEDWSVARLLPYASHLLDVFGADRIMFGSDWPVVELMATYGEWVEAVETMTRHLDPKASAAIFHDTAARFYGIG